MSTYKHIISYGQKIIRHHKTLHRYRQDIHTNYRKEENKLYQHQVQSHNYQVILCYIMGSHPCEVNPEYRIINVRALCVVVYSMTEV